MPIYEFRCDRCENEFEELCKSTDVKKMKCPKCGGASRRKVASRVGLQFKGSGWYITDYASKSSSMSPTEEEKSKATEPEKPKKKKTEEKD